MFQCLPCYADWSPDIYRRQARNLAWYDQEGEPSSRNPFKKFKVQPRRSNSIQLESRLAGEARGLEEQQSQPVMASDPARSEQAGTLPPTTSGADRSETEAKLEPQPSTHSCEPINVSNSNDDDANENKPRRRRTFLGKFRAHKADTDDSSQSPKSISEPKFTVASQIKATVFNSWMNLLILAAPAGSKSECPFYECQC